MEEPFHTRETIVTSCDTALSKGRQNEFVNRYEIFAEHDHI